MSTRKLLAHRRLQANQRRLLGIAGLLALATALVGFVIYQNSQPNNRPAAEIVPGDKTPVPFADGKALGAPEAPVTIQEFADFQCPFCKRFHDTLQAQIVEHYVATGQARFEFHHFIVVDGNVGGNESRRAAEASECANAQDRFWNYHAMVYANQQGEGQGAFSDQRLTTFAEMLGLDLPQFNACFGSGRYAQAVRDDEQLGRSLGVRATPTLFVNGVLVPDPFNLDRLAAMVEAELEKTP